ncbi:MAG: nucleotide sugar dehydrogenase [Candidatus Hydrogenedens sp.]|nr:nucleotide sugar dehydrogenase [Candidatus Hydrogenedens sp.]
MDIEPILRRIHDRDYTVGVVGLGYVGMPLVLEFCRQGFRCIGFDIDPAKVEQLERGESYIQHIPAEPVTAFIREGRFIPTTNYSRAAEADALLLCVPTPLGRHREPDLSYIVNTGESLVPHLKQGQLVVLESTTYPGTTDEVLREVLERGGLVAGKDFLLAYSPEREDPGNADFSTGKIPKVVGGFDEASLQLADALYRSIVVSTVCVSDTRTAEAVKLLENIFRSVNIALVNELKIVYGKMGIDIWEVIEAAKTKPFGFMPFYPGPGLGGHCIPIDPFYLSWKAREYGISTRFIELAGEVNTSMPAHVVRCLSAELNRRGLPLKDARILLLGVAYKKDVGDVRESPGLTLIELLQAEGARVEYNDPYVPHLPRMRKHDLDLESVPLSPESLAAYDAVLIATAHADFDYLEIVRHARLVVDTRNATALITEGREKIVKA